MAHFLCSSFLFVCNVAVSIQVRLHCVYIFSLLFFAWIERANCMNTRISLSVKNSHFGSKHIPVDFAECQVIVGNCRVNCQHLVVCYTVKPK